MLLSCGTAREYAYISDAQRDSAVAIVQSYNATIRPGDLLYIYVQSLDPESVIPFNQETHKLVQTVGKNLFVDTTHRAQQESQSVSQTQQQVTVEQTAGYLVSDHGTIVFPVLGPLKVDGITQDSLSALLRQRLVDGGYVLDPEVTTRLMNFRVTVAGEVNAPNEYYVNGERLTIFEALALAKDLTLHGRRENVTVIRDEDGTVTPYRLDLTKSEVLQSPCYYLRSNDIVYVEPSDKRKRVATRNEQIPNYISIGVSGMATVNNILRIITQYQSQRL